VLSEERRVEIKIIREKVIKFMILLAVKIVTFVRRFKYDLRK
jgi:hypothetical protein